MKFRGFWLAMMLALAMVSFASAAVSITAGTSSPRYPPGGTIAVSGSAYNGTSAAANQTVNLTLLSGATVVNTSSSSSTLADGSFSASILAPQAEGYYNASIVIGTGNATIQVQVTRVSDILLFLVNATDGHYEVQLGSCAGYEYNATEINGTVRCGRFANSTGSNFSVLSQNSTGMFDSAYLDDDSNFSFNQDGDNSPVQKFLSRDSNADVGGRTFTVLFIDPMGGIVALGQKIQPVFFGTGSENGTVLGIVLNESGAPLSGYNGSFQFRNSTGQAEGNGTVYPGNTTSNGTIEYDINLSSLGGLHFVQSGDSDQLSYNVKKFLLRPDIQDSSGNALSGTSPGTNITLLASVVTTTTQTAISTANVSVVISGPDSYSANMYLSYNSTSETYRKTFTAPSQEGAYSAEFTATYNGSSSSVSISFQVSQYKLVVRPIAKGKDGASDGFPTNQPGMVLVGARNLSNGQFLNLTNLTSNCNPAYVQLLGVFNDNGTDMKGNLSLMVPGLSSGTFNTPLANFSTFVQSTFGGGPGPEGVPQEVLDAMAEIAGSGACAIMFAAPPVSGTFSAQVNTTVGGSSRLSFETVRVQDLFVDAFPMSANGGFQPSVAPGQTVYLGINAFDPNSGQSLNSSQILSIQLVEVNAEGRVVTNKMLNQTFGTTAGFASLSFVANDSVLGHHFARFKVVANLSNATHQRVVEAFGDGFFEEELYRVFASPRQKFTREGNGTEQRFGGSFGSNDNVTMQVEVRDSSGVNAQQGLTVTLSNVFHMESFQNVNTTSSSSCTTASNGACQINVSNSRSWKSGGYNVRVKVTDDNNNTVYGYGWFEVRNFGFWAYTQSFEVSSTQPVTFNLDARFFNGTGLSGTASIERVIYFGSFNSWAPPTVANSSISATGTFANGVGNITLPAGSISQSGQYAAVITATLADGSSEITQAWFMARPFTMFVEPAGNNWEGSYGVGDTVNYTVKAYDSIDWRTWPPSGVGHNITAAYVGSVEKMGFWGQSYKTKSQMNLQNGVTSSCSANQCSLTFNTNGFSQGEYMVRVMANDSTGSTAEWMMFMRVQAVRITVPQLMNWLTISSDNTATNATSITVDGDCGGSTDTPAEPAAVTNCKYEALTLLNKTYSGMPTGDFAGSTDYPVTCFLLDKNNVTLWILNNTVSCGNSTNATGVFFNWTNASNAFAVNTTQTFTDTAGNRWLVSSIDFTSNVVYLQSASGVRGTFQDMGPQASNYTYLIRVDQTKSKSGTFIYSKNMQEFMRDEQWSEVDLDGDGDTMNDNYFLVLSDAAQSGRYDTLFVANTTNMNSGVESSTTTTNGINLSALAQPIYLVSIRYTAPSSGAAGQYTLTLTTNRAGWGGVNLGTYQSGSVIKVPLMVTSPSNTSNRLANRPVRLRGLSSWGGMFSRELSLQASNCIGGGSVSGVACSYNTSSTGVALIVLNTSNMSVQPESGAYFLSVEACTKNSTQFDQCTSLANWAGPNMQWENPQIEIRNFEVSGQYGRQGLLRAISKLSTDAATVLSSLSDEVQVNGTLFGNQNGCPNWSNGTLDFQCANFWDFRFNKMRLYQNYSAVNSTLWAIDANQNGTPEETYVISGALPVTVPLIGENGVRMFINVTGLNYPQLSYQIAYPGILADADTVSNPWNPFPMPSTVRVLNGANGWNVLVMNSKGRKTGADINGWEGPLDTVYLVNATGANVYPSAGGQNKSLGQVLPEVNKAVMKAFKWDPLVLLTNLSFNGNYPKGLPWSCDDPTFYMVNFTEASANVQVRDNMGGFGGVVALNDTKPYFAVFFDGKCDGRARITNAIVSPSMDFSTDWVNFQSYNGTPGGGQWDYDGPSALAMGEWKNWMEIGRDGWPFTINTFETGNAGNVTATLFKQDWGPFQSNQTLNLFVTARYFDGTPVSGNVSVATVTGFTYGCASGPVETVQNVSGFANFSNGLGFLSVNISNLSGGFFNAKFVVRENLTGQSENLVKDIPVTGSFGGGFGGPGPMEEGPGGTGPGPECGPGEGPGGKGGFI